MSKILSRFYVYNDIAAYPTHTFAPFLPLQSSLLSFCAVTSVYGRLQLEISYQHKGDSHRAM